MTGIHERSVGYRVEHIMGMPIGIDVRDVDVDPDAVDRVYDWFRWVDQTFSTYQESSEISRINRGILTVDQADPRVGEVLRRCEELRLETDGYFDIWTDSLPVALTASGGTTRSGVDPSGYVKGWAVDEGAAILDAAGYRNYSINAGGDMRLRGAALPASHWRVGIRHPYESDRVAVVVAASDMAVATSGAYERGAHILNPHTGEPASGAVSVTVVGPSLGTADAYATAIYAMGRKGPEWAASRHGYESLIILDDGRVLSTRWFPRAPA